MKKTLRSVMTALLVLCMLAASSLAAAPLVNAEGAMQAIGFAVHAILPDNQRDTKGYFDLTMTPSQSQVLEVSVINEMETPLVVTVEINNASSNPNGLIVYPSADTRDETLVTALTDIASLRTDLMTIGPDHPIQSLEDGRLTIAPGTTAIVPIGLQMPKTPLAGQILGGIVVSKVNAEEGAQIASMAVSSVYSYAIAVQLQEAGEPPAPEFVLLSAEPGTVAGWNAVTVNLHNPQARVVTGAQARVQVRSSTGETVLDHQANRVAMAPNSLLPYTVTYPTGASPEPGDYTASVEWTYGSTVWNMETELVIPVTTP